VTEAKRRTVCKLTSDFCGIDYRHFFIRGYVEIPIIGHSGVLAWGVWSLLSKESLRRALELFETDPDENEPPRLGWLSNNIEGYPPTLNLETNVYFQTQMLRPKFVLKPTDHPLAMEQHNGITIERVQEIAAVLRHRH
jgi:hypothetical protein